VQCADQHLNLMKLVNISWKYTAMQPIFTTWCTLAQSVVLL